MNRPVQKYPWLKWLIVLLALFGVELIVRFLLVWRGFPVAAFWVSVAFVVLGSIWCYYGLYLRRDRIWARNLFIYLVASNVMWLAFLFFLLTGRIQWAINTIGIWALAAIGLVGVWAITRIVSAGRPITGIARTVILQATRLHIVKVVVVAVVLLIILLPGALDPQERLNYRVSFYLEWSLRLSSFLLSIMTAVLGCYTITSDLSRRQMFMLASKPVGRFQYLIGKWLGLVLLNVVLCAIVGAGVWLGAKAMAAGPLPNPPTPEARRDHRITNEDVLAARITAFPSPGRETNLQAMVQAEFEELKRQAGDVQYPQTLEELDAGTLGELRGKAIAKWHTIPPGQVRTYVFEGFKALADEFAELVASRQALIEEHGRLLKENRREEAAQLEARINAIQPPPPVLKLRLRPKQAAPAPDRMVRMGIRIAGQARELSPTPEDTVHELDIAHWAIEPDGRVVVSLLNINPRNPQATHPEPIKFEPYEGIEMLYSVGTFEGNVVRAMMVHWARLSFLAMLAIAAGTFLGFPMACLASLFVYGVAVFSSFAAESLDYYAPFSVKDKSTWEVLLAVLQGMWNGVTSGDFGVVLKLFVKLVGDVTLAVVPSFAYYNSTPLIADGRMVSYQLVGETFLYVGLIWTGICLLIGWLVFRNKELARVTV